MAGSEDKTYDVDAVTEQMGSMTVSDSTASEDGMYPVVCDFPL